MIKYKFHYNFKSLEGTTKPSTSSATGKPANGQQYATLDGVGQQSNLTRSKEDDVFSNLTVSNNAYQNSNQLPLHGHHQTPSSTNKTRMTVSPLYVQGTTDLRGRSTAQHSSSIPTAHDPLL